MPRGLPRVRAVAVCAGACALAAVAVTLLGADLTAASLDQIAHLFATSRVDLAPLARLFGETSVGPRSRIVFALYEGLLFGAGLAAGLTHRPRARSRAAGVPAGPLSEG